MIVVMGATGRTGRKITETLLKAGLQVRALGRSEGKLAELERAGAETRCGDAADAGFLKEAFRGAAAVYAMQTTNPAAPDCRADEERKGLAVASAIRACGVPCVVAMSSLGAGSSEAAGLIAHMRAQEQRLRQLEGINLMLLRPGVFFENFYDALGMIRRYGVVRDSIAPDLAIPWVSTRDIAGIAARALLSRDWTGVRVREILGPRDMTYPETARIIGEQIGLPGLRYVPFSYAEQTGEMLKAGCSRNFADLYMDMMRSMNSGALKPVAGRTPENTTPTRLEDFAREFARAIGAARPPLWRRILSWPRRRLSR